MGSARRDWRSGWDLAFERDASQAAERHGIVESSYLISRVYMLSFFARNSEEED